MAIVILGWRDEAYRAFARFPIAQVQTMLATVTVDDERVADLITPQELERHLALTAEERNWAPAYGQSLSALISLVFR